MFQYESLSAVSGAPVQPGASVIRPGRPVPPSLVGLQHRSADDGAVCGNSGFCLLSWDEPCSSLISPPVSASDCDSGENADLTYYTLSPDFIISPHGTIFPAGPLDYERMNHLYEFVVMAVDKGEVPRTGTTTVRIRMANVNDEAPDFSQHV